MKEAALVMFDKMSCEKVKFVDQILITFKGL